jgi:hypothetical protein
VKVIALAQGFCGDYLPGVASEPSLVIVRLAGPINLNDLLLVAKNRCNWG